MFKEKTKDNKINSIMDLLNENNGYVTTKELTKMGIHRMNISLMEKEGIIERVARGIYLDSNKIEDDYYIFSISMPNTIFSHMTALYFHGLSIKAPDKKFDITVRKNYNNSHLKEHDVFYVSEDIFSLGVTDVETPLGNKVRAYDMERCICDIVRSKSRLDSEHVKYSIREYLKRKDKNLVNLSVYAEKMGIRGEVIQYLEVFYE